MGELQKLFETPKYVYMRSFFEGIEVVFIQDKSNPYGLYVSAESMARIMGYSSAEEMLGDDQILDAINQYMRVTGNDFPILNITDHLK